MKNTRVDISIDKQQRWRGESPKDDLQSLERKYQQAVRAKENAKTFEEYYHVKALFEELGNYKDAVEQYRYCEAVGAGIYEKQLTVRERMEVRAREREQREAVRLNEITMEKLKTLRRTIFGTALAVFVLTVGILVYYQTHRWTNMVDISCGYYHTAGVRADGTVKAVGYNRYGQCAVYGWKDIVDIAVGDCHTVGLKSDGTVVAVGNNKYGQCDVTGWTDIVQISACEYYTVGLKSDGTVVATGRNNNGQCNVEELKNVKQVCASRRMTLALLENGQIVGITNSVHAKYAEGWSEVVSISANKFNFMGLRPDGSVICTGSDLYGQLAVNDWSDIVAVASGYEHSVGLKSDGTVVAAGVNNYGECDVENWTGIVSIIAGNRITIGIKADGSVVAAGDYKYGGLLCVWATEE